MSGPLSASPVQRRASLQRGLARLVGRDELVPVSKRNERLSLAGAETVNQGRQHDCTFGV